MSAAFFHDDITWCAINDCPVISCRRNRVNMKQKAGLHSYGMFKGTDDCPVSRNIDSCMDGCLHAKQCFSNRDDPDEALRDLQDLYCDDCIFSSVEED